VHIEVLSLFPEYFQGPLSESMLKRAQEKALIEINLVNIRDYALDKHRKVDDRPYGGGPGMVLMPEPLTRAIEARKREDTYVVYMSPQGEKLSASLAKEMAKKKEMLIICGHYEGIDERVIQKEVDKEISIGDFVLTNGCLAACVFIDAMSRFIEGVVGDQKGVHEDSFESGLLDWPHYTRPENFEGMKVPQVLLSGNHKEIELWRKREARKKTEVMRPDLYENS